MAANSSRFPKPGSDSWRREPQARKPLWNITKYNETPMLPKEIIKQKIEYMIKNIVNYIYMEDKLRTFYLSIIPGGLQRFEKTKPSNFEEILTSLIKQIDNNTLDKISDLDVLLPEIQIIKSPYSYNIKPLDIADYIYDEEDDGRIEGEQPKIITELKRERTLSSKINGINKLSNLITSKYLNYSGKCGLELKEYFTRDKNLDMLTRMDEMFSNIISRFSMVYIIDGENQYNSRSHGRENIPEFLTKINESDDKCCFFISKSNITTFDHLLSDKVFRIRCNGVTMVHDKREGNASITNILHKNNGFDDAIILFLSFVCGRNGKKFLVVSGDDNIKPEYKDLILLPFIVTTSINSDHFCVNLDPTVNYIDRRFILTTFPEKLSDMKQYSPRGLDYFPVKYRYKEKYLKYKSKYLKLKQILEQK